MGTRLLSDHWFGLSRFIRGLFAYWRTVSFKSEYFKTSRGIPSGPAVLPVLIFFFAGLYSSGEQALVYRYVLKYLLYVFISLQCRRFLWARNLLAKEPCWNFPKRGRDGASQRERGGGGEREEKTPARKHCENEKHPLIRRAWPLFWKWVADNNKTTKPVQRLSTRLALS